MKKSFADILNDSRTQQLRKAAAKIPEWAEAAGVEFPTALSLEQCSSSLSAAYKAGIAAKLCPNPRIADLTGGLGVDTLAFSRIAQAVLYNEANAALAQAAERNFAALGATGITVSNCLCSADNIPVADFAPDIIYLDPARRDGCGRKVFLPSDCSPDVVSMMPALLQACRFVMVKLSPMADIALLCKLFGAPLREVHVVGARGECKELLCILDSQGAGGCRTTVAQLEENGTHVQEISDGEDMPAIAAPSPGMLLAEPLPALKKAATGLQTCRIFSLEMMHPFTSLYICPQDEGRLGHFFKLFTILEVADFGRRAFKDVGTRYPKAEVSACNVPVTSDELRARLGVSSGPDIHIFGCSTATGRVLIIARRREG